jgi:hypothetical protein
VNEENDMERTLELPELNQAVLDAPTVDALFEDIHRCAQLIEVIVKHSTRSYASEGSFTAQQARQMLEDGSASSVQIRYFFEDAQWWDTLIRTGDGFRVVRIRHDIEMTWQP